MIGRLHQQQIGSVKFPVAPGGMSRTRRPHLLSWWHAVELIWVAEALLRGMQGLACLLALMSPMLLHAGPVLHGPHAMHQQLEKEHRRALHTWLDNLVRARVWDLAKP